MWESAALPIWRLSLIRLVVQPLPHPLSLTTTSTVNSSAMGRTPTKSVARVYADVNAKLGPSWHEYGTVQYNTSGLPPVPTSDLAFEDNLQVQWGSQDHYEIVRKVGRGKYSEVSVDLDDLPTLGSHLLNQKFPSKRSLKEFTSSTTKSVS